MGESFINAQESNEKILSSLPLQISLYYNKFFAAFFIFLNALVLIYKEYKFPYPDAVIGWEISTLCLYALVESIRLVLASRGNRTQQVVPTLVFIMLSGPIIIGHIFFLRWQTYILRLDEIVNWIGLSLVGFQILFGLVAVITFAQNSSI